MHRMLQVPGHMLRGEREVLVPNRNFLGAKYWMGIYIVPQFVDCCTSCCKRLGMELEERATPVGTDVAVPSTESSMQVKTAA
jgi:hypothetical protein